MSKRLLPFAVAALAACAHRPPAAPAPDADELAIYAAVVDSVLAAPGVPFVVIADSTSTSHDSGEQLRSTVRELDPTFPDAALTDFDARNRRAAPLPADIHASVPVRIFSPARLFVPDGNLRQEYATFLSTYAPATGFHTVSRPGIDPERRRAVVVVGSHCGALCGHGQVVLLERGAGGWHVTARRGTWVS